MLVRSDLVWALWLLLFLALEIPAACGVVPWDTLSQTSWINEHLHPWLKPVLTGFLIGLVVHIGYGTGLWRTTLGGVAVALVLNFLWLA